MSLFDPARTSGPSHANSLPNCKFSGSESKDRSTPESGQFRVMMIDGRERAREAKQCGSGQISHFPSGDFPIRAQIIVSPLLPKSVLYDNHKIEDFRSRILVLAKVLLKRAQRNNGK